MNSIMFDLRITTSASLSGYVLEDYMDEVEAEVVAQDLDTNQERVIGHVDVDVLQVGMAMNEGESLADICDNDSSGWAQLYDLLFEDGELRSSIDEMFGGVLGHDVVFIHDIRIDSKWESTELVDVIFRRLTDLLGKDCAVVATYRSLLRNWKKMGFCRLDDNLVITDTGRKQPVSMDVLSERLEKKYKSRSITTRSQTNA